MDPYKLFGLVLIGVAVEVLSILVVQVFFLSEDIFNPRKWRLVLTRIERYLVVAFAPLVLLVYGACVLCSRRRFGSWLYAKLRRRYVRTHPVLDIGDPY